MKILLILTAIASQLTWASLGKPRSAKLNHFFNSAYLDQTKETLYLGVSEVHEGLSDESGLYVYSLSTKKGKWLTLNGDLQSQHIIGIYPSAQKDEVFILSQLRKAGTAKPFLSTYNLNKKSFKIILPEIDCANIINSSSVKDSLNLECGEDPQHMPAQNKISLNVKGILESANQSPISWIPQKPNSMLEARAIVIEQNKELLRIEAASLFKSK